VCQKETQRTTRGRVPRSGLTAESGNEILRDCWDWETSAGALLCRRGPLRSWLYAPVDPLPAAKVCRKALVRKSDFGAYLDRHRVKRLVEIDVDTIVRDVLNRKGAKVAALGSTKNNPRNRGGRARKLAGIVRPAVDLWGRNDLWFRNYDPCGYRILER